MRNNELCTRHKTLQTNNNDRDNKLSFLCLHKGCPERFKLCCLKCRSEFHKDHSTRVISMVDYIKDFDKLKVELSRRQQRATQLNDLDRKLMLIKDFRLNLNIQQASLIAVNRKCISTVSEIDKFAQQKQSLIEKLSQEFRESDRTDNGNKVLTKMQQILEFNVQKMKIELSNDRTKNFQEIKTKLEQQAEVYIGRTKEYLMKIIEVLLDKSEQEVKRPKKQTNIEANIEEMKKLLQGQLTQLEKEINEKSAIAQNIRERLIGLGVPMQKQENSNSHTPRSTKRSSQLGVNDLPLVRSQSRQDSRPEYMSADKNAAIQQKRNQQRLRDLEAQNSQLMAQIRLLDNKLNEMSDLKKQLDKLATEREKAVIDFKQISEQYNELIYEYNSLKDKNLHAQPPQAEFEQLSTQNRLLEQEKSKISQQKAQLLNKLEDITKQLDVSTKQLKSNRDKSANSNTKLESQLTERKKQLENEKKSHQKTKSEINTLKEQLKLLKQVANNPQSKKKTSILENQLKSLKVQNQKIKTELKNTKAQQEQLKGQKDKLKNEYKKFKQLHQTTKNDLNKLEKELHQAKNAEIKASQEASKRKYDFDCLTKETNALQEQLNQVTNELKEEKQINLKSFNELNCLKASLNQSEQHCKNLLKECESFRVRYDQLSSSYQKMSKQCEVVDKNEYQKTEIQRLTVENTKLINQLSKVKEQNTKILMNVSQKAQNDHDFSVKLKLQEDQAANLSRQIASLTAENKQLKSEIQQLSNHCGRLNKENKKICKQLDQAHEQLHIVQEQIKVSKGQSKETNDRCDELRSIVSEKESQVKRMVYKIEQERLNMQREINALRQYVQNRESIIVQLNDRLNSTNVIKNEVQLLLDKTTQDFQRTNNAVLAEKEKLLKQLYVNQNSVRQFESKSKSDEFKLKEAEKKFSESEGRLRIAEERLRETESKLESADAKYKQEIVRSSNYENKVKQCQHKIRQLQFKIKSDENKCISLDSYSKNMQQQLTSTIESLENFKKTTISLQQMLHNQSKQFAVVNQEYKNVSHQVVLLTAQLNSAKKQLHEQQLKNDEIHKSMADRDSIIKQLDESHRMRYELDLQIKKCLDELHQLTGVLQQKDKEIVYLKNEIDERIKVFEYAERRLFQDQNALEKHYQNEIGKMAELIEAKDFQIGSKIRKIDELQEKQQQMVKKLVFLEGKQKNNQIQIEALKNNIMRQRQEVLLKNSDMVLFHKRIQELEMKVQSEKRQTMLADKNNQELRYQIEQLTKLQISQQKQKQSLHIQLKQLHKIKQDLEKNIDDMRGHVETLRVDLTQHDGLKKRCQQLDMEAQELRQSLNRAHGELQSARMENKQIENVKSREINRLNEAGLAFCQKLQEAEEARERIQSQCHLLKNQCSMLKMQNEQLRAHLSESQQNQKIIKMLQEDLMRKNHELNKTDIDNRQLKLEVERLHKSKATDDGASRIVRSEEIMNLNREISSIREQLNEQRIRNRQLLIQLDSVNRKNMEMNQKLASGVTGVTKLSKNSPEYRAIHQIIVTLKEDMTILQGRIKRKDDIEKIYLKELEVKKSQQQRLRQQNECLKKSMEQHSRSPSIILSVGPSSTTTIKPGQALARVKNKENKAQDSMTYERSGPFLESVQK